MNKLFLRAAILVVLFFIPKMVLGNVAINEIMYDLDGSDDGREWIEIFNNGDTTIDISGWKLHENETNHGLTVAQGMFSISANGYAIITDKPDKFLIDNPSYSGILFDSTFSLNNSGESLILKDGTLSITDEVNYSSSWGANGNGRTLQRENNGTLWGSGIPTPGELNNISPEESIPTESTPGPPPIIVNENPPIADAGDNIIGFVNQEIKLDGSMSSDPDGNELQYSWNTGDGNSSDHQIVLHKYLYPGTYLAVLTVYDSKTYITDTITVQIQQAGIIINEFFPDPINGWIEIYNDADSIVDISGWQLENTASGSIGFVFPKNTFIAPKSYLVFPQQSTKIALNSKDSIKLLMPGEILFQEINYENPPQGKSSARTAEGFVWLEPSPGITNISSIVIIPKQTIAQINPVQSQTVKEPSTDYTVNQSNIEISGGYVQLAGPETRNVINQAEKPFNLMLLIICIVVGSGFIGLLLVKFRKKSLTPS